MRTTNRLLKGSLVLAPPRWMESATVEKKYALYMEVERDVSIGQPVADRALPSYAWNEELIRDHMDRVIEDISDITVLSPTVCLIFRGRRS